ncbi:MAG: four helix bundle protein [Nitrospirota bacterium]
MKDYKELNVWRKGIELVIKVYRITRDFPREETYALTDQIKRAAVSISSNIAEGASRNTTKEFIQFLYIALGSAAELETLLLISERVGYLENMDNLASDIISIRKMLNSLILSLKRRHTYAK